MMIYDYKINVIFSSISITRIAYSKYQGFYYYSIFSTHLSGYWNLINTSYLYLYTIH